MLYYFCLGYSGEARLLPAIEKSRVVHRRADGASKLSPDTDAAGTARNPVVTTASHSAYLCRTKVNTGRLQQTDPSFSCSASSVSFSSRSLESVSGRGRSPTVESSRIRSGSNKWIDNNRIKTGRKSRKAGHLVRPRHFVTQVNIATAFIKSYPRGCTLLALASIPPSEHIVNSIFAQAHKGSGCLLPTSFTDVGYDARVEKSDSEKGNEIAEFFFV